MIHSLCKYTRHLWEFPQCKSTPAVFYQFINSLIHYNLYYPPDSFSLSYHTIPYWPVPFLVFLTISPTCPGEDRCLRCNLNGVLVLTCKGCRVPPIRGTTESSTRSGSHTFNVSPSHSVLYSFWRSGSFDGRDVTRRTRQYSTGRGLYKFEILATGSHSF